MPDGSDEQSIVWYGRPRRAARAEEAGRVIFPLSGVCAIAALTRISQDVAFELGGT
jgi:hypothetical protein